MEDYDKKIKEIVESLSPEEQGILKAVLKIESKQEREKQAENAELEKERRLQEALLSIKKKFGKNSILKAMNLQEGATAKDRNQQVGGHKA